MTASPQLRPKEGSVRYSDAPRLWARARLELLRLRRPEFGALGATGAVFVFFSIWTNNFLTLSAIGSTLTQAAELGVVAMAVTLLMIAGEFDLSVGSVLGITSVIVPFLMVNNDVSAPMAVACAFLAALSIGLINGLIVVIVRIPSFIVTLGGLLFWRGLLFVVTQGFPVRVPLGSPVFNVFSYRFDSGFNVSTVWFAAVFIVLGLALVKSPFGNWIYASGGNDRAARSMGVPVDRVKVVLFALTALAAGLAGLIQVGRFNSVDAQRGTGLELDAIAAVVIGGTKLTGGSGTVFGTVLGCLMVGMIRNGLALAGVASYWYEAIIGLLIVGATIVNHFIAGTRAPRQ